MVTVQYRRWCPPRSPLRIEFPPELLHEVRANHELRSKSVQPARRLPLRWIPRLNRAATHSSGLLFGIRQDNEVRVITANAEPHPGLDLVGIFVFRERGEVFLTDDDLANFEKCQGVLALVIAGGRGGFFVREPDGSVQAIRSHEEFKVADAASHPATAEMNSVNEVPAAPGRGWRSIWKRLLAFMALLAVPAGAFAYLRPLLPSMPLSLVLHEEAGQLLIGWSASALADGGRLEIQDAGERTILLLPAHASSATYARLSDYIQVRLSTGARVGAAHWEAAKFVKKAPRPAPASLLLQDQVGALTLEAQQLRSALAAGQARTKALAVQINELTARPKP